MSRELRVASIGLGRVSGGHLQGWDVCEHGRIVALCDIDADKIAAAQEKHGLQDARAVSNYTDLLTMDDVDAVDICLPDYLHRQVVLDAAEAGKHVLCEKPLAMTAAQAEEMLGAVEAAGVVHQIRFQRRNSRLVSYVEHLIRQGALGELRHFRCRFAVHRISDPAVKLEWRLQADQGCYGVLGDLGAHALDLAFYVMGPAAGEIARACAMPATFIPMREYEDGKGTGEVTGYDAIGFAVMYERNVLGSFEMSRFSPGTDVWQVDGQKACIQIAGSGADSFMWFEREPRDDQVPASRFVERRVPDEFPKPSSEFDAFAVAALQHEPASPDFNDGLRVARALDMVAQAAEKAR